MSFGQKPSVVNDRRHTDERIYFLDINGEIFAVQYCGDNTHVSPAFHDATRSPPWRRGYGGVRVFSGHVEPLPMSEILFAMDGARREGIEEGKEIARHAVRHALGLVS